MKTHHFYFFVYAFTSSSSFCSYGCLCLMPLLLHIMRLNLIIFSLPSHSRVSVRKLFGFCIYLSFRDETRDLLRNNKKMIILLCQNFNTHNEWWRALFLKKYKHYSKEEKTHTKKHSKLAQEKVRCHAGK